MSDTRRVTLTRRRGLARWYAVIACVVGVLTIAVAAAGLAFVAIFAIARLWTWIRGRDIDQFVLWELAPGAAVALAIGAVLAFAVLAFRWFWIGAVDKVLAGIEATPLDASKPEPQRIANLVEELSVGLGQLPCEIWVTDDPTPNALSLRSRNRRVICVTTGVYQLSRPDQEALLAHELAHVWADDAHWVTSALVALATTRRAGTEMWAVGLLLVFVSGYVLVKGWTLMWGTLAVGIGLFVLGAFAHLVLRPFELGVRRASDQIADVAAVQLCRNPESLGALCLKLAEHEGRVGPNPTAAQYLWFEAVEQVSDENDPAVWVVQRSRAEMYDRAERAYAEARVPMPEKSRMRMEQWRINRV